MQGVDINTNVELERDSGQITEMSFKDALEDGPYDFKAQLIPTIFIKLAETEGLITVEQLVVLYSDLMRELTLTRTVRDHDAYYKSFYDNLVSELDLIVEDPVERQLYQNFAQDLNRRLNIYPELEQPREESVWKRLQFWKR